MSNPSTPAPLTDRAKGALLDYAERVFSQGIDDSYRSLTDLPGLIADPNPPSPTFILPKALTRQTCRRWARGSAIVRGPGFDAGWSAVCGPYLDSIGEEPAPGQLAPPYFGGQCPAVYQVFATIDGEDLSIGGQTPRNLQGPLGSVSRVFTNLGGNPNRTRYRFIFSGPNDGVEFTSVTEFTNNPGFRIAGRVDGQPDSCGNLEFEYLPPPTPPNLPFLPPVSVDVPGIGPVNVDIDFDDDGNVVVKLPDLGIEVTAPNPFGPDDGGGGGGGGGDTFPPGFQGQPGDSQDVSDEPAEGEDPERFLVGVLVQTIAIPPRVKTRWNDSTAYYGGLYYVYQGGNEGLAQSPAALVRSNEFFYAPEGANRFIVEPNPGVAVRVTPFWRDMVA